MNTLHLLEPAVCPLALAVSLPRGFVCWIFGAAIIGFFLFLCVIQIVAYFRGKTGGPPDNQGGATNA